MASGPTVRNHILLTRNKYWLESEHQSFLLLSQQPWIADITEFFVTKDGEERLVVHAQDELGETQEEESALLHGPGCSHALALDGSVAALGLIVERRAAENCLPSIRAATWLNRSLITVTMFLAQP